MKRRIKTVVTVATLALTTSASINAQACDRGGRRISISHGRIGASFSPFQRYSSPVYSQPQNVYSQPQNVYHQPQVVYPQPVQTLPPSQVQVPQNNVGGVNGAFPGSVNPGTLAGRQVMPNGNPNLAPQQQVGQRAAPTAPASVPRTLANNPTPASPAAGQSQASAEASALQLLASISSAASVNTQAENASSVAQIPEFAPAADATAPSHVGTWSVNLPGSQAVELVLNSDGSFRWTATKNGSASNFDGQYRLENDRLTLVRSNDLQQMAGSWTANEQGFSFKLDGATTGGLGFTRS